jgi:transposase
MGRQNKYKPFRDLVEHEKDAIINYIILKNCSIKQASKHFNLTEKTISKVFETRFKKQ